MVRKGFAFLLSLCLGVTWGYPPDWLTDLTEARIAAAERQVPILLVFEGSDWCSPCKKLNKNIFNTEEFQAYARDRLILLKADFPRKKKPGLDPAQREKNNRLAEIYNPEGYFPLVLVLDKNGRVLGKTGYQDVTPQEYIRLLNRFIQPPATEQIFKRRLRLMGSRFEITVVAGDSVHANRWIDLAIDEIRRIEKLISSWDPRSQTSRINRLAGIRPVEVNQELLALIQRAVGISQLTDGAFDISYAALDQIWKFDGSMTSLPSDSLIRAAREKIGYQNIVLDAQNKTVFLTAKGMKIGFGALGKGYAADRAKTILISKGVSAGIINAAGDIAAWGRQPNGQAWKIAITNPFNKENAFALIPIENRAVVTSGDYEKMVLLNGQRYTHIIDPRTGYPATGLCSVTVFAPRAELADALATAVFVLGIDVGLNRVNQLPNVECIIIDDEGGLHTSRHLALNTRL